MANMHYTIRSVRQKQHMVRRILVAGIIGIASVGAMTFPAFADGGGYCVNSENGCAASMSNTPCAGHGAFGAFSGTANNGQQGSAVHGYVLQDKAEGTTLGAETGAANSALCGNPQN